MDIHVEAKTASSPPKSVFLVIEVKGCWNPGVKTSLDSQLAKRYLKENRSSYGIYLVVWFTCDAWDDRDGKRKTMASKETLADLTSFLDAQASLVSSPNGVCVKSFVLDATLRGLPQKAEGLREARQGHGRKEGNSAQGNWQKTGAELTSPAFTETA